MTYSQTAYSSLRLVWQWSLIALWSAPNCSITLTCGTGNRFSFVRICLHCGSSWKTSKNRPARPALASLTSGIAKFRNESMECLMYSDWPQFESFCERIRVASTDFPSLGGSAASVSVLSRDPLESGSDARGFGRTDRPSQAMPQPHSISAATTTKRCPCSETIPHVLHLRWRFRKGREGMIFKSETSSRNLAGIYMWATTVAGGLIYFLAGYRINTNIIDCAVPGHSRSYCLTQLQNCHQDPAV